MLRLVLEDRFDGVLGAARAGDTEAFALLFESAQPMLLRFLRVRAGADAEDVASQTWIHVIEGLDRFSGNEVGFRRWVATIARNLHVDLVRRGVRRPETPVDDVSALSPDDRVPDVAELVETRDATRAALALVATLPPDLAELVMLRVVVGLDVAEVAALTGRSSGSVRVAVHRALKRLRATLESSGADGADVTSDELVAFN